MTSDRPGFGFSVTPGPVTGVAEESVRAEAMGYDRIGIWDSPALFRDPWLTIGAVAAQTSRVRIGTWVTNPVTRHPLVQAAAAATVDDIAPGRVYVGIGAGGTGVWHLGLPTARQAELEAYAVALRELLVQGRTTYRGSPIELPWAGPRRVPVIMSAHGERSLELAGRVADGVIVGLGIAPEVVASALERVERGARMAGRRIEDLEVWFTCFWWVDPVPGAARATGAWSATAFALHFAASGVDNKFVPEDLRRPLLEVGRSYDLHSHGHPTEEQKAAYVDLADRLGVGEYLRHRFMFAGTPAEVEEQVRVAMRAGATNFDGAIDADLPEHERRITAWADHVLPRFAAAGEETP